MNYTYDGNRYKTNHKTSHNGFFSIDSPFMRNKRNNQNRKKYTGNEYEIVHH